MCDELMTQSAVLKESEIYMNNSVCSYNYEDFLNLSIFFYCNYTRLKYTVLHVYFKVKAYTSRL